MYLFFLEKNFFYLIEKLKIQNEGNSDQIYYIFSIYLTTIGFLVFSQKSLNYHSAANIINHFFEVAKKLSLSSFYDDNKTKFNKTNNNQVNFNNFEINQINDAFKKLKSENNFDLDYFTFAILFLYVLYKSENNQDFFTSNNIVIIHNQLLNKNLKNQNTTKNIDGFIDNCFNATKSLFKDNDINDNIKVFIKNNFNIFYNYFYNNTNSKG